MVSVSGSGHQSDKRDKQANAFFRRRIDRVTDLFVYLRCELVVTVTRCRLVGWRVGGGNENCRSSAADSFISTGGFLVRPRPRSIGCMHRACSIDC